MRYINDGGGLIRIDFWRDTNNVICRIRDNGPGREESRRIKSKQHIEYQSRGMDLTQRRVDILNMIFEEKVTIDVNDVRNDLGLVAGTEVMITITQVNNEDNN
jgi:anti-sigma regulatory factor (Ser/Thr protein kinase)